MLVNCPRCSNGDGGGQLFSVKLRVMADDASNMTTLILDLGKSRLLDSHNAIGHSVHLTTGSLEQGGAVAEARIGVVL